MKIENNPKLEKVRFIKVTELKLTQIELIYRLIHRYPSTSGSTTGSETQSYGFNLRLNSL